MLVYLRNGRAQTTGACCHSETDVADQTFYLTQSQYTDTGSISPSADAITPGAWQGSHWRTSFSVTALIRPGKRSTAKMGIEPRSAAHEAGHLTSTSSPSSPGKVKYRRNITSQGMLFPSSGPRPSRRISSPHTAAGWGWGWGRRGKGGGWGRGGGGGCRWACMSNGEAGSGWWNKLSATGWKPLASLGSDNPRWPLGTAFLSRLKTFVHCIARVILVDRWALLFLLLAFLLPPPPPPSRP